MIVKLIDLLLLISLLIKGTSASAPLAAGIPLYIRLIISRLVYMSLLFSFGRNLCLGLGSQVGFYAIPYLDSYLK